MVKKLTGFVLLVVCFLVLAACQPNVEEPAGALTPTVNQMMPIIIDNDAATAALPDLLTLSYQVNYDDCPWGGSGQVTVQVKNNGQGPAGPFEVQINGSLTTVNGLPAGQQSAATVQFPAGPVGGVNVVIDPTNQIAETNETNNTYQIAFTPPPPCATPTP